MTTRGVEPGAVETASAVAPAEDDAVREPEPVELAFSFSGSAREYFRVWIVNLCLTLFSLGIFSAWAKVRKKRYLYSHIRLEGVPFQYLGDPIPILKGRLIASVLFATYYVGMHFSLKLLLGVLAVAVVLAPWVVVRSAAFNARYSAYRNFTFAFSGTYWGAAKMLLGALLQVILTCSLGYPWAVVRFRKFMIENASFGGVRAHFSARGGHFAKPYLIAALGVGVCAFALYFAIGSGNGAQLLKHATYVSAVTYFLYALAYAYLQARIGCLNWQFTRIGPISFEANYRARDFLWLYFGNAVAVLASLGLLIPWAAIRTQRYRVEHLRVFLSGSLHEFRGSESSVVRATGAEVADLFDFDLSL
jgi:uncharacterized membrane protein YjgN (DUF898 family)